VARIVRRAPLQEVHRKIMDMSDRRVISTGLVCTLVTAVLSSPSRVLPATASATTTTSAPRALAAPSGNGFHVPEGMAVAGTQAATGTRAHTSTATPARSATATQALAVSYTGTDYYIPWPSITGCPNWAWLTSCYTNPSATQTAQQQVSSDAAFMARDGQGAFQRVWVSLDELMYWNATTGYQGFNPRYLANLDDALARFHANGIKVDLMLYGASKGTSDQYQFHTEALDGNHATMRAGYLQALRDFVNHLAQSPTDTATVAVMDLFNEAYWQLEQFGYSDSVIHQWLTDEYNAAHGAQPAFNYTVSDTTRLLKDYSFWQDMYPVDVYDIHVYDDAPWNNASFYARALALQKPWFSGEAACASYDTTCTYQGNTNCGQPSTCAMSVDSWWLHNLKADGAQAVLVESSSTTWSYPHGPNGQTLTLVGQAIQSTTHTQGATP